MKSFAAMGQRERIEMLSALEALKDAACAVQAEVAVAVVKDEIAAAKAAADESVDPGAPAKVRAAARERRVARARRSAVGQVALARRESPHRAGVLVGAAEALVAEMPCTLAALRTGAINEHRAVLLVRETACLDREDRAEVDREVCADPSQLAGIGSRRLVSLAAKHAYRLDPASVVRRAERCATERNVTLRPAPGSMTYLTALLPMAQGVGVLAGLRRAAETARATGDQRSTGQVMADTLVERTTGQPTADAVPVTVNLIMSDATLLGAGHEPAVLDGAHHVPAQLARELVARAMELDDEAPSAPPDGHRAPPDRHGDAKHGDADHGDADHGENPTPPPDPRRDTARLGAWVRRLYSDAGGNLVAMDSRTRTFPAGLARLLRVRDQGLCRTPFCDAPIAHTDHITPAGQGGATSAANGQGLCSGCNYTKQAPGWDQTSAPESITSADSPRNDRGMGGSDRHTGSSERSTGGDCDCSCGRATRHTVTTTTPTGHVYVSSAPELPMPLRLAAKGPARRPDSAIEATFRAIIEMNYCQPTHIAAGFSAGHRPAGSPGATVTPEVATSGDTVTPEVATSGDTVTPEVAVTSGDDGTSGDDSDSGDGRGAPPPPGESGSQAGGSDGIDQVG